jgi:hypothetical protein
LPLTEQVADIRLSWQRKEYKAFRIEVHNLMRDMRY